MKTIILLVMIIGSLLIVQSVFAVGVMWDDPNPASMGVTGYNLYFMPEDGNPANARVIHCTDTQTTVDNNELLYGQPYVFMVTAVNVNGESPPSDPAIYTLPWPGGDPTVPSAPAGIQFTDDLGTPVSSNPAVMP